MISIHTPYKFAIILMKNYTECMDMCTALFIFCLKCAANRIAA